MQSTSAALASDNHGAHRAEAPTGVPFATAFQSALHAYSPRAATPQLPKPSTAAGDHDIHERALAIGAYRLQLLASNIANADTPGYKARDIDVSQALRDRTRVADIPVQYTVPYQPSLDGNSVDLDQERAKFAEAVLRYEFAFDRVSGHYKNMVDLIKSTP